MTKIYASRTAEIEQREIDHAAISKEIAGECVVLLENDGVLPLCGTGKIALYGNGARGTVRGGTGSGDVNTRSNTNIEEGFEKLGFEVLTKAWLDRQEAKIAKDKADYQTMLRAEAQKQNKPEIAIIFDMPYKEKAVIAVEESDIYSDITDTAVYVISRNSGEGADRKCEDGDYLLYREERANIQKLAKAYKKFIVILNIGGVMDLTELNSIEGVNAVVLMGQLGNLGGEAIAEIVAGKVTPSGKTTDTWAKDYWDYPSSKEFSHNGSVHDEDYTDGIYVGYRYFDTFGKQVLYPFGYGRSYTEFEIGEAVTSVDGEKVSVALKVKNIGDSYSGKEVVQVYYSAPAGKLDKPCKELIAYAKTSLLGPGDSEELEINFNLRDMASYSEDKAAWILEKGNYVIQVGNSSFATKAIAVLAFDDEVVTEQTKNLFELDRELAEIRPDRSEENVTDDLPVIEVRTENIATVKVEYQKERRLLTTEKTGVLTIADVKADKCTVEDLVAQLTVEEMAQMCVGTMRMGEGSIVGNASQLVPGAAGDSSPVLYESRGIKNMILADGPAGLRLQPHFKTNKKGELIPGGSVFGDTIEPFPADIDESEVDNYYQYCTAIPIGWSIAQAWNDSLAQKAGDMIGKEMEQFGVDLWLAPALNIHRNPLCGRNFEYYSEDPVIAGRVAAAITNGVQLHEGKGTTIKHFAANNQEENRYFVNAHISERAIREIYIKGFEIAVKTSQPYSIMTSYNLLNGTHTANHYDLLQSAARDEWGFEGTVMTDWFTSQDIGMLTGKYEAQYPISASTGCIFAGNDIQMPGCQKNVDDIIHAVTEEKEIDGHKITKADLQFCTANIIRVIAKM